MANLRQADLYVAEATNANLSRALLFEADLSGAKLSHANLSHADLTGAKLSHANLSGGDLSYAKLFVADLSDADLSGADVSYAGFCRTTMPDRTVNNSGCPSGGGPPPPPAPPPTITKFSQSAKRWLAGSALPHYARAVVPVGTTFRYTLNMPARVRFVFTRRIAGRTVTAATLTHQGHKGGNTLHFEGRLNRRKTLAPGTYTLEITATVDGAKSNTATLRFTMLPPPSTIVPPPRPPSGVVD